jgi:hypothetical protein
MRLSGPAYSIQYIAAVCGNIYSITINEGMIQFKEMGFLCSIKANFSTY